MLLFAFAGRAHGDPRVTPAPCTPIGPEQQLRCARVSVPEDRTRPDGRVISLRVVVVPASGERTLPPLYDLAGGPGIAATESADFWLTDGAVHRRHRDVVLVDQRGTGGSSPLACPEVTIGDPQAETLDLAAVSACRERLAAESDLGRYGTAEAVADLEAVRVALGHERIDLSGLSYGTRVVQAYLGAHPDRVRAVALIGALAPDVKLPVDFARAAQAVLDELLRQCAADTACHAAIPDLGSDIAILAAREPGRYWEAVRAQLVSATGQRRLPWLLHEAAHGARGPLDAAVTRHAPEPGANGMFLSVVCPEDTLHVPPAEEAAARAGPFGDYRLKQQIAACRAWGLPPAERPRFVRAEVPVLLVAGSMDSVTPVANAKRIASHLPRARVVTIPQMGHFPDGLTHMECLDLIIAEFFEAGNAAGLHLDCIRTMKAPPFLH